MERPMTAMRVVREAWNALEAGDRARLSQLLSEDVTYADSTAFPHKPEFSGREETLDFLFAMRRAYPDMRLRIASIFSAGDKVVLEGLMIGSHAQESVIHGATIPATERQISLPICQICTVRDGQIVRGASYYDAATVSTQIGLVPQAAAVPA